MTLTNFDYILLFSLSYLEIVHEENEAGGGIICIDKYLFKLNCSGLFCPSKDN